MDYYFTTHRSELDYELDAMLDTLLFTCIGCKAIDMHGMEVVEEFNGNFVMTGVLCRKCQKDKLLTPK